jgi:phosphoribosylaminoimidazolecarboxamide formyltransferase/IMP cyclohydrolase
MQTTTGSTPSCDRRGGTITGGDDAAYWRLVAGEPADDATLADLQFAWRAVRAVKSNAILLARDGASVGIGMGQVNRVDSCRLAVSRAREPSGHAARSLPPTPSSRSPTACRSCSTRACGRSWRPGGSMRDPEVIEAASAPA